MTYTAKSNGNTKLKAQKYMKMESAVVLQLLLDNTAYEQHVKAGVNV